ncbi:MAG TPA: sugar ABC transporter permease [Stellaceae bacterium]|jgi:multiple sugar transport system permease protein|nr:sugar ABC transporter permease [Stellaceae bacterium]
MADGTQVLPNRAAVATQPNLAGRLRSRFWRGHLQGSEYAWALAFCVPYILVFFVFVVYPVAFGIWMGSEPKLYTQLFSDPIYEMTLVNTAIYLGVAINLKMFCALLLSGFFMRPGWWNKALLMIFVLPWAVPSLPVFISIHWLLNGEFGLLNNLIYDVFHITAPDWLTSRWTALGSAMLSHIWKWMPFWTVILLAGRMAIPSEIKDAAKVDGATGIRSFIHVSFPLLANLYLICTLLSTIFSLGDFNTIYFVTGGGPADTTHVLATLGIRYAFDLAEPRLGVAAVISALPLLIPLVIILMRKFRTSQVQL